MPMLRFSLRTLFIVVAIAMICAAVSHYAIHYEERNILINNRSGEGMVYIDDRPLGVTPIRLSYRELVALSGGKVDEDAPDDFTPSHCGALLISVRKPDGTHPLIWFAPIPGGREIETPFGKAALRRALLQHRGSPIHSALIEAGARPPAPDHFELQVVLAKDGTRHCELKAPAKFSKYLQAQKLRTGINLRTTKSMWPQLVEKVLAPEEWQREGDYLIAAIELPELEPNFYWVDGYLQNEDKSRVKLGDRKKEPEIIPTAFTVPAPNVKGKGK